MSKKALNPLIAIFGNEKRWVNWRYKTRDNKPTKVLCLPSGINASSTNPETWSTYDNLSSAIGKGIIFTPDNLTLGVDLDHILMPESGTVILNQPFSSAVCDFIAKSDTYTEFSPSETGVHLYFKLSEPFIPVRNKKDFVSPEGKKYGYECYTHGRFFTVTEKPFGEEKPIRTITPAEANELLTILGYPWENNASIRQPVPTPPSAVSQSLDDLEVLNAMFNARNGSKIRSLYDGDTTEYSNDDSAADMALCYHLAFWTGKNTEQIERLWLSSVLGARDKTQKRPDYRNRTISNAVEHCDETYSKATDANNTTTNDSTILAPSKLTPLTPAQIVDKWGIISCDDLTTKEFPPTQFLVEPFFERDNLNMISAGSNTWKSWLLMDMAFAISKGEKWLGVFQTDKRKVLYITEDDTEADMARRKKKIRTDEKEGYDVYFMAMKGFALDKESVCKEILVAAQELGCTLVIMETLRTIHSGNENDSTDMQKVMNNMRIFVRGGVSVVFSHHNRKKHKDAAGGDYESSRGSNSVNGAISGHIALEEEIHDDQKYVVVKHLKSKVVKKIDPFEILVDTTREEDTGKIYFKFKGSHTGEAKSHDVAREQILQYLKQHQDRWVPRTEINASVDKAGSTNADRALASLLDAKLIYRSTSKALGQKIAGKGMPNRLFFMYRNYDDALQAQLEYENI